MAGFNFGGAAGGATAGASFGPIGAAVGGLLGGFFGGGGPSPEQRALYRLQARAARETQRYARSVPMSDPAERAALASQLGLLGEAQRAQQADLLGALGPNYGAIGDLLQNLGNEQIGQRQQISLAHFLEALRRRRAAWGESSQIAAGAVPAASAMGRGAGVDIGGILNSLAQSYAYKEGLRRYGGRVGGAPTVRPGRTAPPGIPGVDVSNQLAAASVQRLQAKLDRSYDDSLARFAAMHPPGEPVRMGAPTPPAWFYGARR